jgi:hypothetical protein
VERLADPGPPLPRLGARGPPAAAAADPGSRPVPPVPPGLRVERVAGLEALRDWERVAVDGFPYRELQPYRPGALLHEGVLADGRLRLWVGYEAGRCVSARCSWPRGWPPSRSG